MRFSHVSDCYGTCLVRSANNAAADYVISCYFLSLSRCRVQMYAGFNSVHKICNNRLKSKFKSAVVQCNIVTLVIQGLSGRGKDYHHVLVLRTAFMFRCGSFYYSYGYIGSKVSLGL